MSSPERSIGPQNRQRREDETLSVSHDVVGKRDSSHVLEGHASQPLPAAQRGVDPLVNGDARPRK